jgi:predicted GIY-YIG superfamily endonuclease
MSGETGSGKSLSALAIAHDIDPSFGVDNLERRLAKSVDEFLDFTTTMSKGQVLVWDEAGIGLSSAEWWKRANILMNYVLQTFRHENICVIFTAPTMKDLDSKARTRFHFYAEPVGINFREKFAKVKFRRWQHNSEKGKTYSKRLIHKEDNFKFYVTYIEVPLVPKAMVDKYESIMKPWKRNLKEDIRIELAEMKQDMTKNASERDIIKEILDDTDSLKELVIKRKTSNRLWLDPALVSVKYGIGATKAKRVARYITKNVKLPKPGKRLNQ